LISTRIDLVDGAWGSDPGTSPFFRFTWLMSIQPSPFRSSQWPKTPGSGRWGRRVSVSSMKMPLRFMRMRFWPAASETSVRYW
jgi:hypothetical protein